MDGEKIPVRRSSHIAPQRPQLSRTVFRPSVAKTAQPAFQPPDAVEASDETDSTFGGNGPSQQNSHETKTPKTHRSWRFWQAWHKKQWIIAGSAAAVIIIGGTATTLMLTHHKKAVPPKPQMAVVKPPVVTQPVATTVASTLTGLQVDPSVNQRPVTAVMIENSTFARPQSGLDQAGVVFEARAEGGITRFVALYQDSSPSYIGPVRSVRPYYLEWLLGFDAAVAHVGGSGEALNDIKSWGVKNLDQEANGGYFTRVTSRAAPHNVYTSIANLNALEAKLGFGASKYTGFARKAEAPSKTPSATSIDFNISSAAYAAHYDYDASTNTYKRSEGGAPHMELDQNGAKTQIAPKVVLALIMPQSLEADGLHVVYNTIGSGPLYLFQDGIAVQGTWHKASNTAQFTFTDPNGQPLALNAGQTWITALGSSSLVGYK